MPHPKKFKILVVDDEVGIRELLSEILMDEGYVVVTAHNGESALRERTREKPDLILLDIWMPDIDGINVLQQWAQANFAKVPVIVMSGHATINMAVEATKLGATEVLEKPIAMNNLLSVIERALGREHEVDVNPTLQQADFGDSPVMRRLKSELLLASNETLPLMMVGAPNSGGAFFAQFLARYNKPVVLIDSGAKLESNFQTLLKQAAGGLIIIRHIDMLSAVQQNGLLGLLREASKAGVMVVACSAQTPDELKEKSNYNEILISMLSRHSVKVPALQDYRDDWPKTVRMICHQLGKDSDRADKTPTATAMEVLLNRNYENDFAELLSILRSALLCTGGDKIEANTVKAMAEQLTGLSVISTMDIGNMSYRAARDAFESEYFLRIIDIADGNVPQAAKLAGLERTYFYRKLRQYREGKADRPS